MGFPILVRWHFILNQGPGVYFNTRTGRHFADDTFKCIFLKEIACNLIKTSLRFVHKSTIGNRSSFVLVMALVMALYQTWNRPLSEPLMNQFIDAYVHHQGGWSNMCSLVCIGTPIVEIRRSYDCFITTLGFPILVRQNLYIESGSRPQCVNVITTHLKIRYQCIMICWYLGLVSI